MYDKFFYKCDVTCSRHPPPVINCHTFSDPLPIERDVLYGRLLNIPLDYDTTPGRKLGLLRPREGELEACSGLLAATCVLVSLLTYHCELERKNCTFLY